MAAPAQLNSEAKEILPPPAVIVGGVRHSAPAPLNRQSSDEIVSNEASGGASAASGASGAAPPKTSVETALNPPTSVNAAISIVNHATALARPVTQADLEASDGKANASTYHHPEPKNQFRHDAGQHGAAHNPVTHHAIQQPGGAQAHNKQ